MYLALHKINSTEITNLLSKFNINIVELNKKRPSLKIRRIAALAITRHLLVTSGVLSAIDAELVEIKHQKSGQPFLKHPIKQIQMVISISHSGNWIACLLSNPDNPAGIDLEDSSIPRQYEKLAKHFFSDEESKFVEKTGSTGFYRLWTAKEAIAKCKGQGLSEVLKIDLGQQLDKLNPDQLFNIIIGDEDYYISQHFQDDGLIYSIAAKFPF